MYHTNALVTDKGEMLIQGANDSNQLALPLAISQHLRYFPEFMKIDAFNDYFVKDVQISEQIINVLCEHKTTRKVKLFAWGVNKYGQLGLPDNTHIQCEPLDITHLFTEIKSIETEDVIFDEDEIIQISCGSNHTLVLT